MFNVIPIDFLSSAIENQNPEKDVRFCSFPNANIFTITNRKRFVKPNFSLDKPQDSTLYFPKDKNYDSFTFYFIVSTLKLFFQLPIN